VKSQASASLGRPLHRKAELTTWLKSLSNCKLAATVTFGTGRGTAYTSPSIRTVEEIVRKGIKRTNTLCYGNSVKRKGCSIGAVTVIEGTGQYERIHAHIAFEPPPDMPLTQFRALASKAFKPSKWIEQRLHMKECWSQGWIHYELKFGHDGLVPSCCMKAKHISA
jgi:hypothetical protein